jgi:hypothetical protein
VCCCCLAACTVFESESDDADFLIFEAGRFRCQNTALTKRRREAGLLSVAGSTQDVVSMLMTVGDYKLRIP